MGRGIWSATILAIALAAGQADAATRTRIATLHESPELLFGADLQLDIFAVGSGTTSAYWVVRRHQERGSRPPIEGWADSRRCPAILTAIRAWPGEEGLKIKGLPTIIDGSDYQLRYSSNFPGSSPGSWLAASGGENSGVGEWARPFLQNLQSCWPR